MHIKTFSPLHASLIIKPSALHIYTKSFFSLKSTKRMYLLFSLFVIKSESFLSQYTLRYTYVQKSKNLRYKDSYLQCHYIIRNILCMRVINNAFLSLLLRICCKYNGRKRYARRVRIDITFPFRSLPISSLLSFSCKIVVHCIKKLQITIVINVEIAFAFRSEPV